MAITTALLLYEGFDLLDAGGPYEVLLTANRLAERQGRTAPFTVTTLGLGGDPVRAHGGLEVRPDGAAEDATSLSVLLVPGTLDIDAATGDTALVGAVRVLAGRADTVVSVCTGSFLLAEAGLLVGAPATTHHEDVAALGARDDVGEAVSGPPWVDAGTVVTGAGLSSGIATALHLVDRLAGRDLAEATARQLEYAWDPDGAAPRSPDGR